MHRARWTALLLAALLLGWPAAPAPAMRLADESLPSELPSVPSGKQDTRRSQGSGTPAAGTVRTEDGTVITVPKAKEAPRQDGTSVKGKQ